MFARLWGRQDGLRERGRTKPRYSMYDCTRERCSQLTRPRHVILNHKALCDFTANFEWNDIRSDFSLVTTNNRWFLGNQDLRLFPYFKSQWIIFLYQAPAPLHITRRYLAATIAIIGYPIETSDCWCLYTGVELRRRGPPSRWRQSFPEDLGPEP